MSGHELGRFILYEPSNITLSYIQKLFEGEGIKKVDIPIFITHFMCSHNLTDNLWVLERVKQYFMEIDACKPNTDKDKLGKLLYGVCHLLAVTEKQHFVFFNTDERADVFRNDVMNIMVHSAVATFDDIIKLEDIVTEEVYKLLCILFDHLLYAVETKQVLQKTFIILRYLFALTPKQSLLNVGNKMDIIDLVFLICIIYSNNHFCPKDLAAYIGCMKDIFYYRLKKKDKKKRLNIVFYMFHVLIKKHVYSQPIDYEGFHYLNDVITTPLLGHPNINNNDNDLQETNNHQQDTPKGQCQTKVKRVVTNEDVIRKCQFLYLYTEKDEQLEIQMRYERERERMLGQLYRVRTKDIDVDHLLFKDPKNNVNVTRLQYK
jgi:hypothetical protein